ncbi:MAG: MATE family efflux transporter [Spirochaetales bacterium]|nr:MATE family efflux transporter [Spirochaetales bacterium]
MMKNTMKNTMKNFWSAFFKDRIFFATLIQLALPIALQNLLINSLSFVDTVMIGRLGAPEIAAVGLGNQVFFMFILILFGVGSGGAIFVSQYWGKQDITNIRRSQGICLVLASGVALLFGLLSLIIPEGLIGLFSPDPEVIRLGAAYQRITAISYIFTAISFTYAIVLRSVEQARLPLYVTAVSLAFNVVLNYIFIFGMGPLPPLGVSGAALGTTISRGIEMILLLFLVYKPFNGKKGALPIPLRGPAAASFRELLSFDRSFIGRYFKTAAPVIMNEIAWGGGMTVYKAIYARVGTEALASINIAETVINLFFVLLIGSSNATAVMIGKVIGQGDIKKAREYSLRLSILGPAMGVLISIGLLLIARPVTGFFNVPANVKASAAAIMGLTAVWIPFKAFTIHLVVGIFRGGGDTKFGLFLDLFGVWAIGIPITLIGGLHLGLAVPLVYFLAGSEEAVKMIIGLPRLLSGKWANDLTVPDVSVNRG